MLSWCSGRTKSPLMCPTRKRHGYTRGQILQRLDTTGRQLALGTSPACPCWRTATGTSRELPVEASLVSNKAGGSEDPGKKGGSWRVGLWREWQDNLTYYKSHPSVPQVNDCCSWRSKDKESVQNMEPYCPQLTNHTTALALSSLCPL